MCHLDTCIENVKVVFTRVLIRISNRLQRSRPFEGGQSELYLRLLGCNRNSSTADHSRFDLRSSKNVVKVRSQPSPEAVERAFCSICSSAIESGAEFETDCHHNFHESCPHRLQNRDTRCPECRHNLMPEAVSPGPKLGSEYGYTQGVSES